MKKRLFLWIGIICLSVFTACSAKEPEDAVQVITQPEPTETAKTPVSPTPAPTEDLTNKAIDSLTGLYIDKDAAARRPVAVVINNIHKAKPQSGIAQADIIYEVLAEGDITRLVAIFRDFDAEKIGPVRSARHYFLDFALDHDAIFVHHGGSPLGYSEISRLKINNLDGMREADTFWRDPKRVNMAGMYEHSSYTSAENILRDITNKDYRIEIFEDEDSPFQFSNDSEAIKNEEETNRLTVSYSSSYKRNFLYDEATQTYVVYQGEAPHIDDETGDTLAVSNVIVQFVRMRVISGDDAGRRDVDLIGEGDGYLLSNGQFTPITWKKTAHNAPTQWFGSDGSKLTLNKGKTWINVCNGDIDMELPDKEPPEGSKEE